jgi:hypothetical protein
MPEVGLGGRVPPLARRNDIRRMGARLQFWDEGLPGWRTWPLRKGEDPVSTACDLILGLEYRCRVIDGDSVTWDETSLNLLVTFTR